ncbi:hypothetical protein MLD38_031278 [Melastoma candidum]|uniref:Uncharacterized protein n=1 Tax=Melastoma candidum TaxID=119954 RepID=A0ACB9MNL9_9MYRT|nr:hypothetical protein MLD38_031278 [Melastoma candidum]
MILTLLRMNLIARMKAKQKGKQALDSLDGSDDSSSGYSDIKVMDTDTTCTLYADGSYIAHKEEGLLCGVVEKIGNRYKLEWRHTYASVWVRRTPEWVRFQKLDYQCEGRGERSADSASISREIVLRAISIKRKVRDWVVKEVRGERKRRRQKNLLRPR